MGQKDHQIILGKVTDETLKLSVKTLQRHFACFGSSGSGKTVASKVLMEELSRRGIPIIAFDPQGDIASLALIEETDKIKDRGTDPEIKDDFINDVEVVIWTPASSKGLPLCINPLQFDGIDELNSEDRTRYFASISKNIVSLIGYDLDSDNGKSAEAVLSVIFQYCADNNVILNGFNDLIKMLEDMPDFVASRVAAVGSQQFLGGLKKKLSLLTFGARKLIFQTGVPANIDALLGKDGSTDKTRISIIYLNTLHSTEEKEFFISSIANLLYRWMLKNPLSDGQEGVQCAMYIDEIAPYIPPVKVPACKENLELLFRQGRKYGVSCLIATQSPGDIDYKAIGQFSTFILGRLNTKQDIEKVKKRLESVAPKEIDYIVQQLPSLKPGHFLAVSPDEFEKVQQLSVRWLVTKHKVIPEHHLQELVPEKLREFYLNKQIMDDPDRRLSEQNGDEASQDSEPSALAEDTDQSQHAGDLVMDAENDSAENKLLVAKSNIYERDLKNKLRPHLSGTLFKSERLDRPIFKYIPIIMVNLVFIDIKGIFKKSITEIPENLYLDFKTLDIFYVVDKQFKFSSVVDADPHKIEDLDNYCKLESYDKDDVDFDFRALGGKKLNKKKVKSSLERKYRVTVNNSELVLFPVWECNLKHNNSGKTRMIMIDGIFGNQMSIKS